MELSQLDEKRLAALSSRLKELRDEAITGRAESGIEQTWTEDREYYDGIDDSNRAEKMLKPTTSDGRVTRERKSKKSTRSTVFLNLTARYCNAAGAYVADKLFRSDVSNYGLRPTPLPDLIKQSKDTTTPATDERGQPIDLPVMDEQGEPAMAPQIINGQPMIDDATGRPVMLPATKQASVADVAKKIIAEAREACEKAKVQIDDWLVESRINAQSRQVVMDSSIVGTGCMYGPAPEIIKKSAVLTESGKVTLTIKEELIPKVRRLSVWNLYPDPTCGTDIHRGKHIFHDEEINSRELGELKRDPSFIASAIDQVIEEGPKNAVTGTSKRSNNWSKGKTEVFQIWYFHGYLSVEELCACGYEFEQPEALGLMDAPEADHADPEYADEAGEVEGEAPEGEVLPPEPQEERKEQYPCIVAMVNDVVIKAVVSPFDSGRFPYNLMRWQYRDDHWAGLGVSRQMRTSQDGVNAGVRMMHDNAGVSGAPILIIDRKRIEPADGIWTVGPHKVYYTTEDSDGGNIRDAFTWIITPSMQAEMMAIIQFWMSAAEEETGMPMLLQGQQGNVEMTRGEAQMLNNNGSALLRRVTNIYDDDVTKMMIGAFYEWLLIHVEDDSMKGDFTIDALGSSVLIERDAQSQMLMQMLGLALNPAYEQDPALVYKEFLLSQRFDPEKMALSDEKKAEMAKRPPPEDPRVTAAKIMADSRIKLEEMDDKDQADHAAAKAQLQMEAQQFEAAEAQKDRQLAVAIEKANAEIERMKLQGASAQTIQQLKVKLADTTMKLQQQERLSKLSMAQANDHKVADHMMTARNQPKPPTEPVGRASPGNSFPR